MRRLIALSAAALALGACSLAGDVTPPPGLATAQAQGIGLPATAAPLVVPSRSPDLSAGKAIYGEKCAPCHGATGGGDGPQAAELPNPPVAFTDPDVAQKGIPEEWFRVVTEGRFDRFMPGFTSLDDDQRWDVVGYALSLGLPQPMVDAGRIVYQENCASCHGDLGRGDGRLPDLTSPKFQSTRSRLAVYGAVTNGVGEMPAFSQSLNDDERWQVAAFVRSLGLPSAPVIEPEATTTPPATPLAGEATPTAVEGTPAATPTSSAAVGRVVGSVQNGTAGAAVPSGLEITLHSFDGDTEVSTQSVALAPDGSFAFEGLERATGRVYVVTTDYDGVLYSSEIGELPLESDVLELPLRVYETTADTEAVRISRMHVLFDFPAEGVAQVVELWLLSNQGDRTVYDANQGALEISLPQDASGLSLDGGTIGDRFELTDGGFRDKRELVPGENTGQLIFSYNLPYDRRLEFDRRAEYPVEAVVAMVPEGGPSVSGTGIQDMGSREVAGASLHTYELGAVPAGGEVAFSLRGRAGAGASSLPESAPIILGVAALTLALVAAGVLWFRPRRRSAASATPAADDESVLWAIASLDNEFAAGAIDAESYRARREELLRRAQEAAGRD